MIFSISSSLGLRWRFAISSSLSFERRSMFQTVSWANARWFDVSSASPYCFRSWST